MRHRAGPVDAGDPSGAQGAKTRNRGAPGYYTQERGTRLHQPDEDAHRDRGRAGKGCGNRDRSRERGPEQGAGTGAVREPGSV